MEHDCISILDYGIRPSSNFTGCIWRIHIMEVSRVKPCFGRGWKRRESEAKKKKKGMMELTFGSLSAS